MSGARLADCGLPAIGDPGHGPLWSPFHDESDGSVRLPSGSTVDHPERWSRHARKGGVCANGLRRCRSTLAPAGPAARARPVLAILCLLGAAIGMLTMAPPAHARPGGAPVARAKQPHASAAPPLPGRAQRPHGQSAQAAQTSKPPAEAQAQAHSPPADPEASASVDKPLSRSQPNAGTANVPLPPRPTAALAERVQTVLEKHCSRCHQTGALQERLSPERRQKLYERNLLRRMAEIARIEGQEPVAQACLSGIGE